MIDEAGIGARLEHTDTSELRVREVLCKAREIKGLDADDVASLAGVTDPELLAELFETARDIKDAVYGRRLVIFAPLYVSNVCENECLYCAFRSGNAGIRRRMLSRAEIADEVKALVEQGHKRVLIVAGESNTTDGLKHTLDAIDTVYSVRIGRGEIRRVNVNIAPLPVESFRELKAARIGTYQLFQETYHRGTYRKVHAGGPKSDYDWRISAMDRTMEAGIDDVGIGVLFGLHDWRFELLALLRHAAWLEERHGVGPHTISVPRLEPAAGSSMAGSPPCLVDDMAFRKIVAILRLAVPYVGIIMSTRETAEMRRETYSLGVSQISAGSRTSPGAYSGEVEQAAGQFCLGDHRTLDEVIRDIADMGYVPSFCTGCYRLGRTGRDFMDLAKPREIRKHCDPNAISTFVEYLEDYASVETRAAGETAICGMLASMAPGPRRRAEAMISQVREGQRDVFC